MLSSEDEATLAAVSKAGYPRASTRIRRQLLMLKKPARQPALPRIRYRDSSETEVQPSIEPGPTPGGTSPDSNGTMWLNEGNEGGPLWRPRNIEYETRAPQNRQLFMPQREKGRF